MRQRQEVQEVLPGPRVSPAVAPGLALRSALDKLAQPVAPQIRSRSRRLPFTSDRNFMRLTWPRLPPKKARLKIFLISSAKRSAEGQPNWIIRVHWTFTS